MNKDKEIKLVGQSIFGQIYFNKNGQIEKRNNLSVSIQGNIDYIIS